MILRTIPALIILVALASGSLAKEKVDAEVLYQQHCAECHKADRLGATGPALLPQNLGRLKKEEAFVTIREGRPATQMPPFREKLADEQVQGLVALIFTPLPDMPRWGFKEIAESRIQPAAAEVTSDKPVFEADIENLFIVVELGDHHATLLNGDTFEPIHRFPTRFALHGDPKYAEGGRYVYFASGDGWISKFDIFNLRFVAEIRAGLNIRNIAVSHDGRFVMVANYLPHTLVILDARDLSPVKVIEAKDGQGRTSRVNAVYTADPRRSFIAAFKDIREVWEISYRIPPPPGFGHWVHDYRKESGDAGETEPFPIRRLSIEGYLDDFFITPDYAQIAGTAREGAGQVVDLDVGRSLHSLTLPGMPHLSAGITWEYEDTRVLATPDIKEPRVVVLDTRTWKLIQEIPTLGPGFFMHSHESTPYVWVDVLAGKDRDAMQVIDKRTLKVVKILRPAPGKTSAHVEFTKDGRYALVSIRDADGALVVYDAHTLEEVKRIPMKKPSGKYNVHNGLTRSSGTSH